MKEDRYVRPEGVGYTILFFFYLAVFLTFKAYDAK